MKTAHVPRSTPFSAVSVPQGRSCKTLGLFTNAWFPADRRAEQIELEAVGNEWESRGLFHSGPRERAQEDVRLRYRSRRARVRVLGVLIVLVVAASFLSVFHDSNRLLEGIRLSAAAASAPVALLLGLRRRE